MAHELGKSLHDAFRASLLLQERQAIHGHSPNACQASLPPPRSRAKHRDSNGTCCHRCQRFRQPDARMKLPARLGLGLGQRPVLRSRRVPRQRLRRAHRLSRRWSRQLRRFLGVLYRQWIEPHKWSRPPLAQRAPSRWRGDGSCDGDGEVTAAARPAAHRLRTARLDFAVAGRKS